MDSDAGNFWGYVLHFATIDNAFIQFHTMSYMILKATAYFPEPFELFASVASYSTSRGANPTPWEAGAKTAGEVFAP